MIKKNERRKQWLSNRDSCDICSCDMSQGKVEFFVDGKTKGGMWALMCPTCFARHGVGVGMGYGQKYDGMGEVPYIIKGTGQFERAA